MKKLPQTCRIPGCTRRFYCGGLCVIHYPRAKRAGTDALQPDDRINQARTMLKDKPMSVSQLADALGVSAPTAQKVVKELGASMLFNAIPSGKHGTPAPMYSTLRNDIAHTIAVIHKHLSARDELSAKELARLIGMSASSARECMAYLHNAKLVHIGRWTLSYRKYERLWTFGPGIDAPRPAPLTQKEKSQRHAIRMKLDPVLAENRRSVHRRYYVRHNTKPKRDAMVAALFGDAQ